MVAPAVSDVIVSAKGAVKTPRFTLNCVSATLPSSEYAPFTAPGVANGPAKKTGCAAEFTEAATSSGSARNSPFAALSFIP